MISRHPNLLLVASLLLAASFAGCCCPRGPEIASLDADPIESDSSPDAG